MSPQTRGSIPRLQRTESGMGGERIVDLPHTVLRATNTKPIESRPGI
jgi:hypothetical protein